MHSTQARQEYFNDLSSRWDGFTDGERVRAALREVLSAVPIGGQEHVVDLGCGTGNLTAVLAEILGPGGRVTAVDFSGAMIDVARDKVRDPRVRWLVADVARLPLEDRSMDRVICFSAWPHFPDPAAAARELARVLRPGGMLHILHINSRECINGIHSGVGGAIGHDLLPPANDLAGVLSACGFTVREEVDSDTAYRVTGEWPA